MKQGEFRATGDPTAERSLVVIVDDDHAVRESLSVLLEAAGYRTRAHASSVEFMTAGVPYEAPQAAHYQFRCD